MIREAINFVEEFENTEESLQSKREEWRGKKFIIINTKENKERNLEYRGFEILKNDEEIEEWINKNKYYQDFLENISHYIFPRELSQNKALGSTQGLMTFNPISFKLSEKNLRNFDKKLQGTNFESILSKEEDYCFLDGMKSIYSSFKKDLFGKTKDLGALENSIVLLDVNEKVFNKLYELTEKYIKDSSKKLRKNAKNIEGECFVCGKNSSISASGFFSSYAEGKIFLHHKTRKNEDGKGSPNLICEECESKLKDFEKILNDHKLKIFPLFINSNLREKEIKIIKSNGQNTFRFIFDELSKKDSLENLDFYLVVNSGDYLFFDYISNYNLQIGDLKIYFNHLKLGENGEKTYYRNDTIENVKRFSIEKFISEILYSRYLDYFGDLKGDDNQLISLKYKIRQKVFDFVYKNKNSLNKKDIEEILIFRIEKDIRNDKVQKGNITKYLNFFFNLHLIEEKMEKPILEKTEDMKRVFANNEANNFEIRDDSEWAYWCGQIAFFLAYNSKTSNKNFSLLEPFVSKSVSSQIKRTLLEFFEKYKYEIKLTNRNFKKIFNKTLNYQPETKSFSRLKTSFYTGVFDDNIFLNSKNQYKDNE